MIFFLIVILASKIASICMHSTIFFDKKEVSFMTKAIMVWDAVVITWATLLLYKNASIIFN